MSDDMLRLGRFFAMLSMNVVRNGSSRPERSVMVASPRAQVLTPSVRALIAVEALRMLRDGTQRRRFHVTDVVSGVVVRLRDGVYLGDIGGVRCAADFETFGDAEGEGTIEFLLDDPGQNELDLNNPVVCASLYFEDEVIGSVRARIDAAKREEARRAHLRDPRYN